MPLSINSYLEGPVTIRSLIISGILSFNPTYGFCVILWHQSGLLFLAFWSFPRFVPHILLTLSLTFTLMFPLWATTSYQVLSGGLPGLCVHSSLERLAILFYFINSVTLIIEDGRALGNGKGNKNKIYYSVSRPSPVSFPYKILH